MTPEELHRFIRRLHLRVRRKMRDAHLGSYQSPFKGSGLAFAEVREYQPGDDVRRIDWNVTARLNAPFVKRYTEERQRTILLMIDISGSLDFTTQANGKRQVLAELAALVALSATGSRDRVGLLLFAEGIEEYLPPGKATENVPRLLRDILLSRRSGPGTNLAAALDFVNALPVRRAVVFLMSDFLNAGYEAALRRTARKHELIAVRVIDPREEEIPAVGLVRLRDVETGRVLLIDTSSSSFRVHHAKRATQRRSDFQKLMTGARVDSLEVRTTGGHLDALIQFFERRRHRAGSHR